MPITMLTVLFSLTLICYIPKKGMGAKHILQAAIVGRKGNTHIGDYRAVVEELKHPDSSQFCEIRLVEIPYDTSDGRTVYESLTTARSAFAQDNISVVIGPYIDVFTSMAYVIQKQLHLLTVQMAVPDMSDRLLPILPSPDSLSIAVAKIVQKLGWKKVSFLAQAMPTVSASQGGDAYSYREPGHTSNSLGAWQCFLWRNSVG